MKMPLPAASTTSCAHDAHRPPCASSSAPIRAVHAAAASGAPSYRGRLVRAAASAPICTSFAAGSSRRRLHARAERHASHAAEWKVSRVLAVSLQQTPVFSAVRGAPQSAHGRPVPSGSTPPAAATSAIRRARFASAMCVARSGPLFSFTHVRTRVCGREYGKKAHTCFWGRAGALASVQAGNKNRLP